MHRIVKLNIWLTITVMIKITISSAIMTMEIAAYLEKVQCIAPSVFAKVTNQNILVHLDLNQHWLHLRIQKQQQQVQACLIPLCVMNLNRGKFLAYLNRLSLTVLFLKKGKKQK